MDENNPLSHSDSNIFGNGPRRDNVSDEFINNDEPAGDRKGTGDTIYDSSDCTDLRGL